jgi:hypothetical protein
METESVPVSFMLRVFAELTLYQAHKEALSSRWFCLALRKLVLGGLLCIWGKQCRASCLIIKGYSPCSRST